MTHTLEPRLTVRAVRPLISALRVMGHDAAQLAAGVGLESATLNDPDARVPMRAAVALLSHAAEQAGDANIGFHLAQHAELSAFDVHFYAMASSPTLGAAYALLSRYQRLIHDTSRVELERQGDCAILRHSLPGDRAAPRQSAEFLVTTWVRGGRVITGVDWAPLEVRFAHPPPSDTSEHERFFRAEVRFGTGANELVMRTSLLETPCIGADAGLAEVLERYAADRLERAPRSGGIADRVSHALTADLRGGDPTAAGLAARLKMSVRTLNRLLADEGTSYRELLDARRRDIATRYLAGNDVSIAEVAFLLGFSELSSFHRAFKRWTGQTPGEFRTRSHTRTESR